MIFDEIRSGNKMLDAWHGRRCLVGQEEKSIWTPASVATSAAAAHHPLMPETDFALIATMHTRANLYPL